MQVKPISTYNLKFIIFHILDWIYVHILLLVVFFKFLDLLPSINFTLNYTA